MTPTLKLLRIMVLTLLVTTTLAVSSSAQTLRYSFDVSGANLVPPGDPEFGGIAILDLNTTTMRMDGDVVVPLLNYDVQLYRGLPDENGVLVGTFDSIGVTFFFMDLDQVTVDAILVGEAYLLVTTATSPDGIARGQFPPLSVPIDVDSFGGFKRNWSESQ